MKNALRTMLISLALFVGTAYAEREGLYYGISIADVDTEIDNSVTGGTLQLGYKFNKYVAAEGRVGVFSNEADSIVRDPLFKQYGLHGKFGYQWEQISAYALLGYSSTLSSLDETEDGFSAGVEINLFGSPSTAISLGYLTQERDVEDFSSVSIGFIHYLGITSDAISHRHPYKDK